MSPAKKKAARKGPWPPVEVWIIFVDHSALDVYKSYEAAAKVVALRRKHSLLEVDYRIQGYRIDRRGAK